MNDRWKEYVQAARGMPLPDVRHVDRLLKLVDAQDAVVKAAEATNEALLRVGAGRPTLIAALRNLAELKLE